MREFKIRTEKPAYNGYYNCKSDGGLNGAIAGYPEDPSATVLSNCVGYANGRFNEIINDPYIEFISKPLKYQFVCNAENFIEQAKKLGLKITKEPMPGGIVVWQKGKSLSGEDGAGHVAIVESVVSDNEILTSESAYAGYAFRNYRRKNDNGRWGQSSAFVYRGCINNPSLTPIITEKRYVKIKSYRNVYNNPQKEKKIMRLPEGSVVYLTRRCAKWVYIDSLKGWICETDTKLGNCLETINFKAAYFETDRRCVIRSLPIRSADVKERAEKGYTVKGRDIINGYRYVEKEGWITNKWLIEME